MGLEFSMLRYRVAAEHDMITNKFYIVDKNKNKFNNVFIGLNGLTVNRTS